MTRRRDERSTGLGHGPASSIKHAAIVPAVLCTMFWLRLGPAYAGGGAEADPYDDLPAGGRLAATGLFDTYVVHNFNQPATNTNQLRQFDIHSDLPSLNFGRVTVAWRPRRIGFRVDAGFGDTADVYFAEDPASLAHADLSRWLSHIEQAFVTIVALPRRLAIDVGKFNTPVGLEDNETPSNWNYSRSLIFTLCEPTLHTGLRATFIAHASFAVSLFWTNGWNSNFLDGSGMRSYAVAATWRPRDDVEVALVYAGGLEHAPTTLADPQLGFRNVVDAYVVYTPLRWLAVAVTGDYGADTARGGVQFWGVDAYARLRPRAWLALSARAEFFADPDGFTTGVKQSIAAGTATVDVSRRVERSQLTLRLEYRHDDSTAHVFEVEKQANATSRQDTLTAALVAQF